MKNIAKITPEIVIQSIDKIDYLKFMYILAKHGYRNYCDNQGINWKNDYSKAFIKGLAHEGRLQEFYKDLMNEISAKINPGNSNDSDKTEE